MASDKVLEMLRTTGIHQIAEIGADNWKLVKAMVRKGQAVAVECNDFPRPTKRYFAVSA